MRFVAIARIKNEADIVEAFVRHTLAVADHLLVMDHESADSTLDTLHALKSSGLSLDIFESHTFNRQHCEDMTRLMREAATKYEADWVLPLDADEFIVARSGSTVRERLEDCYTEGVPLKLYWRTYVPDRSDDPAEINPALKLRLRLVSEANPWTKVAVPGRFARLPGVRLAQGNHDLIKDNQIYDAPPVKDVHLAHLPVRSKGQYASKVITTYLRYCATPEREPGQGFHYDYPFNQLKISFEAFSNEFYELARQYAVYPGQEFTAETILDPLPYLGGPLKFTRSYDNQQAAISNVLAFAENLARSYARATSTECLEPVAQLLGQS